MMMRSQFSIGLGVLLVAGGCGDSGRGNDEAGASAGPTMATATPTTTMTTAELPTTSEASGTASQSASEAGSASVTQGMTTTATTPTTTATDSETGTTTMPVEMTSGTVTSMTTLTTDTTTGDPCGGSGNGTFDFSYLWVANTDQGSISKVNTETHIEEARYFSELSQNGGSSPSRTSVNIDGHYVVVSNRGTGWVTKVAASEDDCVDVNGNGIIETSHSKDELLAWGTDECVLWSTQVFVPFSGGGGPRATAWAPGDFNPQTCKYDNQKVWIGWLKAPGAAVMGRLDGETGVIEAEVDLPGWPLTADAANGYAPYGAAADADGFIWTTAVYSGLAYRIDPVTLEVKVWQSPNNDSHYGMTVDGKGRVWFANWGGHGGISMFDPDTEQWHLIPGSEGNVLRGIAADPSGNVWAASNAGGARGCGLMQVSADTLAFVTFHNFQPCGTPVGVSIDVEEQVWMVDYDGWAFKINPDTYVQTQVPIANIHYTYSDMTGGGLVNAVITPG